MKRRIAALLMAVGFMLATAAPAALAQGLGGSDPNPGTSEGSNSNHNTPPTEKPGGFHRNSHANEHDSGTSTGFGQRVEEQQP